MIPAENAPAPDFIEEIEAWRAWDAILSVREAFAEHVDYSAWLPELGLLPIEYQTRVGLHSVSNAGRFLSWPTDGWLEATCNFAHQYGYLDPGREAHAPEEGCTCGIYALASVRELGVQGYLRRHPGFWGGGGGEGSSVPVRVHGRVGLAGKVIEGERGYRAARARILEVHIDAPDWHDDLARMIRETYNVPVRRVEIPPDERERIELTTISLNAASLAASMKQASEAMAAVGASLAKYSRVAPAAQPRFGDLSVFNEARLIAQSTRIRDIHALRLASFHRRERRVLMPYRALVRSAAWVGRRVRAATRHARGTGARAARLRRYRRHRAGRRPLTAQAGRRERWCGCHRRARSRRRPARVPSSSRLLAGRGSEPALPSRRQPRRAERGHVLQAAESRTGQA